LVSLVYFVEERIELSDKPEEPNKINKPDKPKKPEKLKGPKR
jgi:hypothetical protein